METPSLIPPSSSSFKKDVMGKLEALGAPVSVSYLWHTIPARPPPPTVGCTTHTVVSSSTPGSVTSN